MMERLQENTSNAVTAMENGKTITDATVEKARQSGESLQSITRDVQELSDMSTRIATAMEQQSTVTEEIKRNMEAINSTVAANSENAVKTADASDRLTVITTEVSEMVGHFKVSNEPVLIGEYERVA